MDKEVLDRLLKERSDRAVAEASLAVELAADGRWIGDSEWKVRQIFQDMTRDCYQLMLQAKADGHRTAAKAAFSPDAGRGAQE